MNPIKLEQLYTIGTVYAESTSSSEADYIKQIKEQLENKYDVKLVKFTKETEMRLVCRWAQTNTCKFLLSFLKKWGHLSELGYELIKVHQQHSELCRMDQESAKYEKTKQFIEENKVNMTYFVAERTAQFGHENPKKLLEAIAIHFGKSQNFIYDGLEANQFLKRKIKKKFDNTLAEIKRLLYPTHKTKKSKIAKKVKRRRIGEENQSEDSEFKVNNEIHRGMKETEKEESQLVRQEDEGQVKVEYEPQVFGDEESRRFFDDIDE